MATPRVKRPFARTGFDLQGQTQITSFFSTNGRPSSDNSSSASAFVPTSAASSTPSTALSTPLPPSVQANLLSVGMRIRKAVPEGYKTGGKVTSFATVVGSSTPAETARPIAPSSPVAIPNSSSSSTASSQIVPPPPLPSCRELQPFCGIHKIGGLAVQPASSYGTGLGNDSNTDLGQPIFPTKLFHGFVESDGSSASSSSSSGSDVDESMEPPSLTTSQETAVSSSSLSSSSSFGPYTDADAHASAASLPWRPSDLPTEAVASARKRQWRSTDHDLDGDLDMYAEPEFRLHGDDDGGHCPEEEESQSNTLRTRAPVDEALLQTCQGHRVLLAMPTRRPTKHKQHKQKQRHAGATAKTGSAGGQTEDGDKATTEWDFGEAGFLDARNWSASNAKTPDFDMGGM